MRAMTRNHTNGHGQWLATGMLMLCVAEPSGAVASDGDLRQQVLERLSDEEAVAAKIDVAVNNDEVTLTGLLASVWEKEWAIERTERTDGVASVVSQLTLVVPRPDTDLARAVAEAIVRYPYYTVFDHVSGFVENGVVTLQGDVTPDRRKSKDIRARVSKVIGVQGVVNEVETLSPAINDARIRFALARRLFNHPSLGRYTGYDPGIHIIVRGGYVTLKGTVYDQADRLIADSESRRTFGVIRVHNELKVRGEVEEVTAPPAAEPGVEPRVVAVIE